MDDVVFEKLVYIGVLTIADSSIGGAVSRAPNGETPDLHLDILYKSDDKLIVSLAHYININYGQQPDPYIEIAIFPKKKNAFALAYETTVPPVKIVVAPNCLNCDLQKSLTDILNEWLSNIVLNGHMFALASREGAIYPLGF